VATFLGLLLALAWPIGIAACLTWLAIGLTARISSLAALVAAAASSVWVIVLGQPQIFFLSVATTLLVFWRHRDNIRRLRAGTEPKFGKKK